jgi:hydroxymethylpyrimidine pyrophosphatase-like HAD family hydrolase
MTRPRLVASDLDGTLLAPGAQLAPRTVAALAAAAAAVLAVVPATGRSYHTALPRLAPAPGIRFVVCSNGAVVYDRAVDAVVDHTPVAAGALPALLASVRAGLPGAVFSWETPGAFGSEAAFLDLPTPAGISFGTVVGTLGPPYPVVTKLFVGHRDLAQDDLLAAVTPLMVDGLVVSSSGAGFIEVTGAGVDKAAGVARVCERLGVDRSEVVALGDHHNDLALLAWAGWGVAMADGHPLVVAAADEIAPPCAEDGAAVVLERLTGAAADP